MMTTKLQLRRELEDLGWVVYGCMFLTLLSPQEEASAADVGPIPVCLLQNNTELGGPVSHP